MAIQRWDTLKVQFCERAGKKVALQANLVFPAEHLPEQPPRITAHRCSNGLECNQFNSPTCTWAGTVPAYDPFQK
ncbi:MAG TPA: hypothetical protein PLV53_09450 [Anaerolineaceae bacterium]|nr:hypothetical protein [Anaerolineaceae bacterium]